MTNLGFLLSELLMQTNYLSLTVRILVLQRVVLPLLALKFKSKFLNLCIHCSSLTLELRDLRCQLIRLICDAPLVIFLLVFELSLGISQQCFLMLESLLFPIILS